MTLRAVQAGEPGVGRSLARVGLGVLSLGWAAAQRLKEAAYATGVARSARLAAPVVSVGNLAAGGTGKTPFVAWLARRLREEGVPAGVLARGYGPRPPGFEVSDEGVLLRRLAWPGLPYVEDPDRRRGAAALLRAHPEVRVLLLDDGFQHRQVARDLDLVLLDATNPFGFGRLLPRGLLRERPAALARAGWVVLTRTERVGADALTSLRAEVARRTSAPVAVARTRAVAVEVEGNALPPEALRGRAVHACSGIGNPDAFVAALTDLAARVVGRTDHPDHALLSPGDWDRVLLRAREGGAEWVVVTRKDAVKCVRLPAGVVVLDVETEVGEGAVDLLADVRRLVLP